MQFFVTPTNITYSPKCSCVIVTDDYSNEEISRGRHIEDIKKDFYNPELKRNWNSRYVYIYPLKNSGPDTKHYSKFIL